MHKPIEPLSPNTVVRSKAQGSVHKYLKFYLSREYITVNITLPPIQCKDDRIFDEK
ncbi:hypothetical protein [Fischerella thermalis]|uniref:hypothetical protein n=1 Tax=Fischerella thermalis TaxID=372787 RepID=UPI0019FCE326|nr:hypothetical protein [Fischerella thermalis]MBF1991702.1 hypothetical protein [Fischerella thermalis M58_A2018_009]